jgi:5-methyltetrahydrofolate--homocysteine methyltransferase
MTTQPSRTDVRAAITAAAQERILVLDGAMGTMIQQLRLDEESGSRTGTRTFAATTTC